MTASYQQIASFCSVVCVQQSRDIPYPLVALRQQQTSTSAHYLNLVKCPTRVLRGPRPSCVHIRYNLHLNTHTRRHIFCPNSVQLKFIRRNIFFLIISFIYISVIFFFINVVHFERHNILPLLHFLQNNNLFLVLIHNSSDHRLLGFLFSSVASRGLFLPLTMM